MSNTTPQEPTMSLSITTIPVFCGDGHDNGYTLIRGRDITGPRVGAIYCEDGGLVLRLDDDVETYLPDNAAETASILRTAGYVLDPESLPMIDDLA
jgi:hypothetical protein